MRWLWSKRTTNVDPADIGTMSIHGTQDCNEPTPEQKTAALQIMEPLKRQRARIFRVPARQTTTSSNVDDCATAKQAAIEEYTQFMARYQYLSPLQDGSTGFTHRALDITTNRVVVLKVYNPRKRRQISRLHSTDALGPASCARHCLLDTELRYLRLCANYSPNVIALLGAFQHPDLPTDTTTVLQYAQLGDLFEIAKAAEMANSEGSDNNGHESALPETLLWHWMSQMTSAVAFLHNDLGDNTAIVHSDLKLENWLVFAPSQPSPLYSHSLQDRQQQQPTDDARHALPPWAYPDVKLADFDLARLASDAPRGDANSTWGTPAAQPPEFPRDSMPGDVWGVGACMHHLAVGEYPIVALPEGRHVSSEARNEYEWRAERKVEDVKGVGLSEDMDEALRGGICAKEGKRVGGMLNMEVGLRWTALEAKTYAGTVIQTRLLGKARDYPLGSWACPEVTTESSNGDSNGTIATIHGTAAVKL